MRPTHLLIPALYSSFIYFLKNFQAGGRNKLPNYVYFVTDACVAFIVFDFVLQ